MWRPGAPSIAPNTCPEGVVMHVWAFVPADAAAGRPTGRLLYERRLGPATPDAVGEADGQAALDQLLPHEALCLVAYDGDTGARLLDDLGGLTLDVALREGLL
jgi:hypothetical protein